MFQLGLKDLKVFMELATISAGENDADIDRLASFETVVMGYGPLLYSLPKHAGFEEFIDCAKQVWDILDKDKKLVDKLVSFCTLNQYNNYFKLFCTPLIFHLIGVELCFFLMQSKTLNLNLLYR